MVDPAPSDDTAIVRCRVCCEEIRVGAQVCVKCNSPQNWTLHLFRWKETLAAILALAPLYSAAISLHRLAVRDRPEPKIRAVVMSCDTVRIAVAVANVGSAAGVVRTPEMELLAGAAVGERYPLDPDDGRSGGSRILRAGETAELNLIRRVGGAEALPIEDPSAQLVVRLHYRGFDGQSGSASDRCAVRSHP